MKEAYQQAVMQSESCVNLHKADEKIESCDTKSLKERFEKGQHLTEKVLKTEDEDSEVFQSGKLFTYIQYTVLFYYGNFFFRNQ